MLGFDVTPDPDPPPTARQRLLDLGPALPADDPATLFVTTARWETDLGLGTARQAALAVTPEGLLWGTWAWEGTAVDLAVARQLRQDLHVRRPPGDRRRVVLHTGPNAVLRVEFADRLGGSFLRIVEDPPDTPRPDDPDEVREAPATGGLRRIWSKAAAGEWSLLETDDEVLGADELAAGFRQLRIAYRDLLRGVGTRPRWRTESAAMPPGQALTWLAMVLRRTAEQHTDLPWPVIRARLVQDGTEEQREIFSACGLPNESRHP